MKKNNIERFSKEQLYLVRDFIETFSDVQTMKTELDKMIYKKEKNFNNRLTIELMKKIGFFDSELFEILKRHDIQNIQDLIDSNLDEWNLTQQRRLELEEAKVWYDFSRMENGGCHK